MNMSLVVEPRVHTHFDTPKIFFFVVLVFSLSLGGSCFLGIKNGSGGMGMAILSLIALLAVFA